MSDDLDLLRELRPAVAPPDPAVVDRERAALLALVEEGATVSAASPPPPERRGRGRRRRVLQVAGALAAGGTLAAAGWAVIQRDPALTTSIECADVGTIDVQTGDPVADCAQAWREAHGTEPPPLEAYTDGSGANVSVLEVGQAPPEGWEPLEDEFRQDVRVQELNDELADVGRGLVSGCFTQPEAVDLVSDQLGRLGLDGWTVRTDPPGPGEPEPGPCVCAVYVHYMDDEIPRELVLRAVSEGQPSGLVQERQLARTLHERMVDGPDQRCMSLDEAVAVTRDVARRLGFDLTGPGFHMDARPRHAGGAPACARPTTRVGGLVQVVLREAPPPAG